VVKEGNCPEVGNVRGEYVLHSLMPRRCSGIHCNQMVLLAVKTLFAPQVTTS